MHCSKAVYNESPFEVLDLDVGRNLHGTVQATAGKHKGVTAKLLCKIWSINKEEADRTINCITQLKQQDTDGPISRRFSTNDRMLRYKRINSHFFTNTLVAKPTRKSRRGYQYVQLFVLDKGFVYSVLMKSRKEFPLVLKEFAQEIGVPTKSILNPIGEHSSGEVRKFAKECAMAIQLLEESTQWADLAEKYISILKAAVLKDLHDSFCPMKLWCYVVKYRNAVYNVTACDTFKLGGVNPHMVTHGQEADISNLCCFKFYEWVYYWDQHENFPEQKGRLGRALGPTKFEGNEMAQYILKDNGEVVP